MESQSQKPSTILFTHYGDDWIRGSERCLLDLLTHIDRNQFNPIVWCNSSVMAEQVRCIGIQVIQSDFPLLLGWHSPRFSLTAFLNLVKQGIKLVDVHNIRLIHANSGAPNQWLNLVARARHIPLLSHLHSSYPMCDRVTLGLHQVAMTVGVSQPVIKQLLEDGMSSERTCVIANGIDTVRLDQQPCVDLRKMLNLSKQSFLIATTASLIYRKGIDLLISAVYQLIKRGVPAHLVVIGDGPERLCLQQQIQQLGLQKKVYLIGERPDVAGLLRGGVDLFVSVAREEAFGLVLAEASLAQLAVIAPAVGGIPDVVVDGETGKLITAEDVTALTHAMCELYLLPIKRIKMGKAGRRHVLNNFTIQHNVHKFEQLYNNLLQNPAMHMHWYSHWVVGRTIINISKKLVELMLNKFNREIRI